MAGPQEVYKSLCILRRQGFFIAREAVAVDEVEIDKLQPQIQDMTMPTLGL